MIVCVQLGVAAGEECELIVEVAMHGGLDGGGADPDRLPSHQCGREAQNPAAPAPQRHDAAGPRLPRRHGREERRAVLLLVLQHVGQSRNDIRYRLADTRSARRRCGSRRTRRLIDPDDASDRQGIPRGQRLRSLQHSDAPPKREPSKGGALRRPPSPSSGSHPPCRGSRWWRAISGRRPPAARGPWSCRRPRRCRP